jgi:hypothetical protein
MECEAHSPSRLTGAVSACGRKQPLTWMYTERLVMTQSGLSDFLNVSDTMQAEFAKIRIARVIPGAIQ